MNTLARDWITDENRVIWVATPLKDGVPVPTEAQILAVMDKASHGSPSPRTPRRSRTHRCSERVAAPGHVTGTRKIDAVGVTEWKLSNGVRVLAKPTDFKADEILFNAYRPGGTSLVPDRDFMSAYFASTIVGLSGVGDFSAVDLGKKLAGKAVRVTASIGATSEGMSGSASPKDLETLFQLIYLRFTAPRLDTSAFQAWKAAADAQLANRDASPYTPFQDTLTVTMSRNHFRGRPITAAVFSEVNAQKAFAVYRDRYSNAKDFTFVFVGNFTLDSLKPFVEKYLGALPNTGRTEHWKDVGDSLPTGVISKTVRKGTEPVAMTVMAFTGPMKWNPQDRFDLLAMGALGQIWLTDKLREQLGGTYSPQFVTGSTRVPHEEYNVIVQYPSSPENVDKLAASVLAIVDSLKNVGPSDADVAKVKEQIIRSRETNLRTNSYWLGNIVGRDQSGEDIAGLLGPYDAMVSKLTAKQIQETAREVPGHQPVREDRARAGEEGAVGRHHAARMHEGRGTASAMGPAGSYLLMFLAGSQSAISGSPVAVLHSPNHRYHAFPPHAGSHAARGCVRRSPGCPRSEEGSHASRLGSLAIDPVTDAFQRRQVDRVHAGAPGGRRRVRRPRDDGHRGVSRAGRVHQPAEQHAGGRTRARRSAGCGRWWPRWSRRRGGQSVHR